MQSNLLVAQLVTCQPLLECRLLPVRLDKATDNLLLVSAPPLRLAGSGVGGGAVHDLVNHASKPSQATGSVPEL